MALLHERLTEQIIGAAFEVYRLLGYGYLEKVYQRAMVVELELRGLRVKSEPNSAVYFKGACVGEYAADLLVEDLVVVELKVAPDLNPPDLAQLINELHTLRHEVGLLINFGRAGVKFKRAINARVNEESGNSGTPDSAR